MYGKTHFQTVPLTAIGPAMKSIQAPPQPVVLVVDDERVIADTLVAILGRSGYSAVAAYDGAIALEIARVIPPQILITDVYMPGMDGIELAIAVRGAVPDCKVLLFSGHASTAEMLALSRQAGYEFNALSKPIHPTDLLAHMSECLTCPSNKVA
jgi:CheY-like chemotaxis protein